MALDSQGLARQRGQRLRNSGTARRVVPPRFRNNRRGFMNWADKHDNRYAQRVQNQLGQKYLDPNQVWSLSGLAGGHNTTMGNGPRPIAGQGGRGGQTPPIIPGMPAGGWQYLPGQGPNGGTPGNPYDTGWGQGQNGGQGGGGGGANLPGLMQGFQFQANGTPLDVQRMQYRWSQMTPEQRRRWARRKAADDTWGYLGFNGGTPGAMDARPREVYQNWLNTLRETQPFGDPNEALRLGRITEDEWRRQRRVRGLDPNAPLPEFGSGPMSLEDMMAARAGNNISTVSVPTTQNQDPMQAAQAAAAVQQASQPQTPAQPTAVQQDPVTAIQAQVKALQNAAMQQQKMGLPLDPQFEMQMRLLNDQLTQALTGANSSKEQLSAYGKQQSGRLSTNQGIEHQDLKDNLAARGVMNSSLYGSNLGDLETNYLRQRQDLANNLASGFSDIYGQESEAILSYNQQLQEALMDLANRAANDRSIISGRAKPRRRRNRGRNA